MATANHPLNVVDLVVVGLQEMLGSAIRVFASSWASILIPALTFSFSYTLPAPLSMLLIAVVVYQSVYFVGVLLPRKKFKIALPWFSREALPYFPVRVIGQLLGSIMGSGLTIFVLPTLRVPRDYMYCGPFYHPELNFPDSQLLVFLCGVGSFFITVSSLVIEGTSYSQVKKASFMAIVCSLVAVLSYPIGGVTDAIAFIGTSTANGCFTAQSLYFGTDAAVDYIAAYPYVYIAGDCLGLIMGSIVYLTILKDSTKLKKE